MIRKVFVAVFCMHLLAVLAICRHYAPSSPIQKRKMVVHSCKPNVVAPPVVVKKKVVSQVKKKSSPKKIPKVPVEEKVELKASQIVLPQPIALKPEVSVPKGNYGEELVDYFCQVLDLPEYGDVIVDLEINNQGKLVSFDILEAKSQKNSLFLKKRLPELSLPCFNEAKRSDETHKYTITFKNMEDSL